MLETGNTHFSQMQQKFLKLFPDLHCLHINGALLMCFYFYDNQKILSKIYAIKIFL